MAHWGKLVVGVVAGVAAVAAWVRYDYRGVEIRVENKMSDMIHDVRLASATETTHRSSIGASDEWVAVLRPGDAESDVNLTFVDYGGESCSATLHVRMRAAARVGVVAIVRSCGVIETAEESRE